MGDSDMQFLVSSGDISSSEVLILRTGDSDVHFLVSSKAISSEGVLNV